MLSKNAYRNFLILQFAFMVSYPLFLSEGAIGKGIELLLGMAVLSLGLFMTSSKRHRMTWALLVGLLMFLLWLSEVFHPEIKGLMLTRVSVLTLFFSRVMYVVARHVFVSPEVSTSNRLYGAVAVYMLASAFFANIYLLLNLVQPGSFTCASALCDGGIDASFRAGGHLYYSLVTLTTVGYGDITPIKPFSAMVSSMEALVGQLYVAIVVARLVGLHLLEQSGSPRLSMRP